jgi:DNA anti-recombination protein RmuC
MIAMLNITLPAKGFVALRNALGEAPAIAISQALDEAQVRGEAELAAKILADAEARLQRASAETAARLQKFQEESNARFEKSREESNARFEKGREESDAKLERSRAEFQQVHRELREQIAQLPNREELKRFATHADLAELRSHVLRLDKKMTMGFLALSALQLAPNAPLFLEWGAKVVGYAIK